MLQKFGLPLVGLTKETLVRIEPKQILGENKSLPDMSLAEKKK